MTFDKSIKNIIIVSLLLICLVLIGVFLYTVAHRPAPSPGQNGIDSVDDELKYEINEFFEAEGKLLVIYPLSQEITLKKGDDPKGFAFSVRNKDESANFSYSIIATGTNTIITKEEVDSYVLNSSGKFSLGPNTQLDSPIIIRLSVPKSAPSCTIEYHLEILTGKEYYASKDIFVTIK